MKRIFLIPIFCSLLACNNTETTAVKISRDSIFKIPADSSIPVLAGSNSFYAYNKSHHPELSYMFDSALQVHDYSGNWDLNADGITDSVSFIGNGGAHLYFHLRIVLSTGTVSDFPFLEFDMPFAGSIEDLRKANFYPPPALPQFAVADFDADGTDEIYLHPDLQQSSIPAEWKNKGLTSQYILLDYAGGKLVLKNFLE